jgi:hypothetical protein
VKALLGELEAVRSLSEVNSLLTDSRILASTAESASNAISVNQVTFRGGYEPLFGPTEPVFMDFSIHNQSDQDVTDVRYRILYRDPEGEVIDVQDVELRHETIPAGLAKRQTTLIPEKTARLIAPNDVKRVEFRIVDFRIK